MAQRRSWKKPAEHPVGRELPTKRLLAYLKIRVDEWRAEDEAGGFRGAIQSIADHVKLNQDALHKVWSGRTKNVEAATLIKVVKNGRVSGDFFLTPGPDDLDYRDFLRGHPHQPPHPGWREFLEQHRANPQLDESVLETLRHMEFAGGVEPDAKTYWQIALAIDRAPRHTESHVRDISR